MGEFAFGQPVRRKEDPRLLTGAGTFIEDRRLDRQAHAVLLRSPHAHARIIAMDPAEAAAMPGVLGIVTGADLARDGIGGIPCDYDPPIFGTGAGLTTPVVRPPFPALARDRVRYVGEGVALVVAETVAQAKDAAERIAVEYEILPAIAETAAANAPDAPLVWGEAPGNVAFVWEAGDRKKTDAAFAAASRVVSVELANNRVVLAALETRGAIGAYDEASGRYTLHAATQMPHG
ncbi:MAG: xanthine dehydrogenase family protein molybdopterin-binding subunit, partial [Roseiarcus sp.]